MELASGLSDAWTILGLQWGDRALGFARLLSTLFLAPSPSRCLPTGSRRDPADPAPPGLSAAQKAKWVRFPERNLGLVGFRFAAVAARAVRDSTDPKRRILADFQRAAGGRASVTVVEWVRKHVCSGTMWYKYTYSVLVFS